MVSPSSLSYRNMVSCHPGAQGGTMARRVQLESSHAQTVPGLGLANGIRRES